MDYKRHSFIIKTALKLIQFSIAKIREEVCNPFLKNERNYRKIWQLESRNLCNFAWRRIFHMWKSQNKESKLKRLRGFVSNGDLRHKIPPGKILTGLSKNTIAGTSEFCPKNMQSFFTLRESRTIQFTKEYLFGLQLI